MASVSCRKRGKKWEYRFDIAKVNGVRQQLSKGGFDTKKDAMAAGVKALAEYNSAGMTFQPSEVSVTDYMKYWLSSYCIHNVSDSTYSAYNTIIHNHIIPELGHYKLKSLTTTIIQDFINDIYVKHCFKKTYMKNILKVIKGALKYAYITAKFISNNPAEYITLPNMSSSADKKEIIILSPTDMKTILDRFKDTPYQYYAFLTAYYTGLRVSEVYGLTWDCVDFNNKTITVNKIVKKIEKDGKYSDGSTIRGIRGKATTRWYLGDCKTKSSYRTIPVSDKLLNALLEYKELQEKNLEDYGEYYLKHYVIDEKTKTNKDVQRIISLPYMDMPIPYQQVYPIFIKENGEFHGTDSTKYPSKVINYELNINFNFHALRHTHATRLIEAGTPVKTVSDRLGHGNVRTTLETYVHVTKNMQLDAVCNFDNISGLDI